MGAFQGEENQPIIEIFRTDGELSTTSRREELHTKQPLSRTTYAPELN